MQAEKIKYKSHLQSAVRKDFFSHRSFQTLFINRRNYCKDAMITKVITMRVVRAELKQNRSPPPTTSLSTILHPSVLMSSPHTFLGGQRTPASPCSSSAGAHLTTTTTTTAAAQHQEQQTATALTYTSYEGNAFRLQFPTTKINILVDPWLVGSLTFGGLSAIYEGKKRATKSVDIDALASETDFILLTMSIDDHCHRPTLQRLPKSIPIVGSPSAAAVARELGYSTVYELDHGQSVTLCDNKITVRATQGALVGPPWSKRENGFVISNFEKDSSHISLYYEPHADFVPSSVAEVGAVDVVVSPPSTQSLLGYNLVKGATDTIPLLKILKPRVFVALMNAEFDATGPLNALLTESGGPEVLKRQLADVPELKDVRVVVPSAGAPVDISL